MQNWFHVIPKNTGLSSYIWVIFCVLPFYFIFRSSSTFEIIFGILMILLFFASYRLSFISQGWPVYIWLGVEMAINIVMVLLFGYVYFALFLAFFIGNLQTKTRFVSLYVVNLVTSVIALTFVFFQESELILPQLPFVVICVIGVSLLPFTMYSRNNRILLEKQLEEANKRISRLMIIEERQRIARDLHDTLGQKLSLIGLKSDLAGKLLNKDIDSAKNEIDDINQTARTALKEVREMVSNMKRVSLRDEVIHVQQVLQAAQMEFKLEGTPELTHTPLLIENVISMCLKEAVTNVVKHSKASVCYVLIKETPDELQIMIKDNGIGFKGKPDATNEHGLKGIQERLEFINGHLEIDSTKGTTLTIHVPNTVQKTNKEGLV